MGPGDFVQAQDPAGEGIQQPTAAVDIVPDMHLFSQTTLRSFIANIQTSQLVRTGWSLHCTAQRQVRGKGGWILEVIQKLKTYRVDMNAFIPSRNYFNLCF